MQRDNARLSWVVPFESDQLRRFSPTASQDRSPGRFDRPGLLSCGLQSSLHTFSQIVQYGLRSSVLLTAVFAVFLLADHFRSLGPVFQVPAPVDDCRWIRLVFRGSIVPDENDPQQIPTAPPLEWMIHRSPPLSKPTLSNSYREVNSR